MAQIGREGKIREKVGAKVLPIPHRNFQERRGKRSNRCFFSIWKGGEEKGTRRECRLENEFHEAAPEICSALKGERNKGRKERKAGPGAALYLALFKGERVGEKRGDKERPSSPISYIIKPCTERGEREREEFKLAKLVQPSLIFFSCHPGMRKGGRVGRRKKKKKVRRARLRLVSVHVVHRPSATREEKKGKKKKGGGEKAGEPAPFQKVGEAAGHLYASRFGKEKKERKGKGETKKANPAAYRYSLTNRPAQSPKKGKKKKMEEKKKKQRKRRRKREEIPAA